MTHAAADIVMLGDSIFDNAAYTRGEPDVVTHLRKLLPPEARATLLAKDGATTRSIGPQIERIPGDATQMVISIGGNDALGHTDLLDAPVTSTAKALDAFAERVTAFEGDYRQAVEPVFARAVPVTVCTIYNGAFEEPDLARRARVALMMFNDVILRVAFERQASVIDLRLVCTGPTDYANPIEPSGPGGLKIATAIVRTTGTPRTGSHSLVVCS